MAKNSNKFTETERPITLEDLKKVERKFAFAFPKEFREHYLIANGGSPEKYLFKKDGIVFVVSEFFPIKFGERDGRFEAVFQDLKIEREVLPKGLIAFADDPGGDFYCFNDTGEIWIYRGEYSDEPERAVTFLANSLREFIDGMFPEDDS